MSNSVIQMAGSASSLCCAWRKLQVEGYRRRQRRGKAGKGSGDRGPGTVTTGC